MLDKIYGYLRVIIFGKCNWLERTDVNMQVRRAYLK